MTRTLPSAVEVAERWVAGMLTTPPVSCPFCNRHTRARRKCQYCKAEWTYEQIRLREEMLRQFINSYDEETKERVRRVGYFRI